MAHRRKQMTFKGYRTKTGEVYECKEGAHVELRDKLGGYKGKLTPQYFRGKRR